MNIRFLYFLIGVLIIQGCARQGRPEGGEKDEVAPVFLTASPTQETIEFKAEKIRISFDEYIKLDKLEQQLVISPPMEKQPIITPIGTSSRDVNIKILDTLKENTTYTFNFGNSVIDNNEGNILRNFKYVFSTGDYIDSLSISGTVKDGFEKETDENISVQLYEITEAYTDSIVYKERPTYVGNTLDSIGFEITNLKEGKYLLVALEDVSKNYKFDSRQDKIAFHKEIITLPTDESFELTLFREELPFTATRPSEVKKGQIYFGYEGNPDGMEIKLLTPTPPDFKSTLIFEEDKDTVSYWYTPNIKDSLHFEILKGDYKKELIVKLRSKKIDSLLVSTEIKGTLSLRDTFSIVTNIPIDKFDKSKISIVDKDSLNVYFSAVLDASKKRLKLNFDKKQREKYKFRILPDAIEDLFGNVNDTLQYSVSTKEESDYGILDLSLNKISSFPFLLELINTKGDVVAREYSIEERKFRFENLEPSEYIVRIIYDTNENGRWDSGNFLLREDPEKVVYYQDVDGPIEIRANWEIPLTFN
ncbi:Ig-like domain-containing protein [Urechidicola vernalis]|uniref:Ig-like domain-containing protein n=1 Tax=Urechidicola vernalis TaxID=3075600 RepID=A0ABU2Y687_9FLAO|nr:Ig-like domain-containing protein [Urechidicola sp. P050]MDT0553713.1 Ig-like domain-containing protein [Urechidicola sp. P050]